MRGHTSGGAAGVEEEEERKSLGTPDLTGISSQQRRDLRSGL